VPSLRGAVIAVFPAPEIDPDERMIPSVNGKFEPALLNAPILAIPSALPLIGELMLDTSIQSDPSKLSTSSLKDTLELVAICWALILVVTKHRQTTMRTIYVIFLERNMLFF
jgi:hypothetical protein